ncbi:MFS transporter [Nesterenkonia sp. HG001]|uniref:MFS transporter n=1 Tax=Nesterenkonia sp. HG001 TaxID=2983207 RepID=UPI002AC544E2|nr:MFS transporter [Nesterenkonia sp. HG001]MDZ5078134.1 MFS transporter [Nesterenkonia sp. HG001]
MAHTTTPEQHDDGGVVAVATEVGSAGGTEAATPLRREPLGRPFNAHLGTVALANLSDGILMTGIPLIAVSLTRSPQEIALLSALFWLPWLFFGLLAGAVIDRADRRRVRMLALSVRVVVMVGLVAVALAGTLSIAVLIGFMGLYGLTQVFADLAGRTMVPQVAPRSRLAAANGRTMAAEKVFNDFIGRPVAGLLVILGAGWVIGVPAAICVAAVLLLTFGLRGDFRAARTGDAGPGDRDVSQTEGAQPAPDQPAGLGSVLEGLRLVMRHRVLRPIVVMSCAANLATTAYFAVYILWVVGEGSAVGLTEAQYPLLAVAGAVGAVVGSLLVERMRTVIPEVPLMLGSFMLQVPLLVLPVLLPRFDALLIGAAVMGFFNMTGNVVAMTLLQRLVPGATLGRVIGAVTTVGFGLMPLGALLGGLVGEHLGLPAVFISAAALLGLSLLYPMLRVSQRMVDDEERGDGSEGGPQGGGEGGSQGEGEGGPYGGPAPTSTSSGESTTAEPLNLARSGHESPSRRRRPRPSAAAERPMRLARQRAQAERSARQSALGGGVEFRWA